MAIRFSMQTGTFEIGRYAGAPILLYPSFFIIAFILSFPFWFLFNLAGVGLAAIFMAVVLVSILIHELAHAAVGRRFGLSIEHIDIQLFGGRVHFRGLPRTLKQDLAVTAAGPLSNLAIWLAAFALLKLVPPSGVALIGAPFARSSFDATAFLLTLLTATAYLNIGLFIVNMLPAFPLDGGRMLYLLVESRWGDRLATLVVGALGVVFAALSTLLLIGTAIAGFPIWSPPSFGINWQAVKAARRGQGGGFALAYGGDLPARRPAWTPARNTSAVPEWLAETSRARKSVAPRQLGRFGYSDPHANRNLRLVFSRDQDERLPVDPQPVVRDGDAPGLADPPRS